MPPASRAISSGRAERRHTATRCHSSCRYSRTGFSDPEANRRRTSASGTACPLDALDWPPEHGQIGAGQPEEEQRDPVTIALQPGQEAGVSAAPRECVSNPKSSPAVAQFADPLQQSRPAFTVSGSLGRTVDTRPAIRSALQELTGSSRSLAGTRRRTSSSRHRWDRRASRDAVTRDFFLLESSRRLRLPLPGLSQAAPSCGCLRASARVRGRRAPACVWYDCPAVSPNSGSISGCHW